MSNDEILALSIALLIIFIIYLVPIIWVLVSGRSHGGAKFGWFLVTVFFSLLGFAAFLIITQASKDRRS
jgi:hypothetical protein